MNVLSLFDGISCGQLALSRAGVKPKNYYASEIDKFAIQIAKKNFPNTIHVGNVQNISPAGLGRIDLILAGSPCQGFSVAGNLLNFDDPRSKLFFDFVRILKTARRQNPDVFFLLENVFMKKEWQNIISNLVGVKPVCLNSNLVSGQNRKRLYWTNLPVTVPNDKGIFLKDIILPDALPVTLTERRTEQAKMVRREHLKQGRDYTPHRSKEFTPRTDGKANCLAGKSTREHLVATTEAGLIVAGFADLNTHEMLKRVYDPAGKSPKLTAVSGGYQEKKISTDGIHWRYLDPVECERLQTLSDGYTEGVSRTQRVKQCGNGWTVDLIAQAFFSEL